jgi:predicted dehydrogenase
VFRWGIVGTGGVARKFVAGLRQTDDGVATLAVGRDAARTAAFAQGVGIAEATTDLAAAVARTDIEAFYVATPPTAHAAAALACIAAGKPVLIEKPLGTSEADATAIISAVMGASVFAMEGLWTLFLPIIAEVRGRVAAGDIGDVRSLSASFGLSNIADARDNQFNPALGGGALLHRGIYPLALSLHLLGPARLEASAATIGATGVDDDVALMLRHSSGALSTLRASLRCAQSNDLVIEGTHGRIQIAAPIYRPWQARLTRRTPALRNASVPHFERLRESSLAQSVQRRLAGRRGHDTLLTRHFTGNGYGHEAEALMAAVRSGQTQSAILPLADSRQAAALIDEARTSWTVGA